MKMKTAEVRLSPLNRTSDAEHKRGTGMEAATNKGGSWRLNQGLEEIYLRIHVIATHSFWSQNPIELNKEHHRKANNLRILI